MGSKTLVTSVRFRPTTLATLAKYMASRQSHHHSMSAIVSECLEDLARLISDQHPEMAFQDIGSATRFLESIGAISQSQKNKKRLFQAQALESLTATQSEADQNSELDLRRMVINQLVKSGETPSAEQLELAQLTLVSSGNLVKNELLPSRPISKEIQGEPVSGEELSPMAMPIEDFRKHMLNFGGSSPKQTEGGNEDDC